MRLLDKYLLREYLVTVAYCVVGFSMFQVMCDLFYRFSSIMEAGLSPLTIARYYVCWLMPYMEYVFPASLLLATLYTLWQFARRGELTAMRAAGISLYRLTVPFLAVGLCFSVFTAVMMETVAPPASQWMADFTDNDFRPVQHKIYANQAHYNAADHRLWLVERFDLKNPDRLTGVKVSEERADGSLKTEWFAARAEWLDGQWWFYNVRVQRYNAAGGPIGSLTPVPGSAHGVQMPFATERPSHFANEVKKWEFLSVRNMLEYLRSHPHLSRDAFASRKADLQLRLAVPWACFVVTLFGIPAGVRSGRESVTVGILLTVFCFFIFHVLTQVGIFLAKRQILWPWAGAWLPNIVFLAAGLRMLYKIR